MTINTIRISKLFRVEIVWVKFRHIFEHVCLCFYGETTINKTTHKSLTRYKVHHTKTIYKLYISSRYVEHLLKIYAKAG